MTIWLGVGREWSRYRRAFVRETAFARDTGWYGLLQAVDDLRPRRTWVAFSSWGEFVSLNDVVFSDVLHGAAVGYVTRFGWASGIAMRTEDGGATWEPDVSVDECGVLSGITRFGGRFASVGSSGQGRALLERFGGGRRATATALPSSAYFFDVDASGATAWVCGERTLLATTNGGKSWRRLAAPSGRLTSVALSGVARGWVISEDLMADGSAIWASVDGGTSFTRQYTLPGSTLRCLDAWSDEHAWACGGDRLGGNGVIVHTADGGLTWTPQLSGEGVPQLADVWMRDAATGWAVGDGGAVYHTSDGGLTWLPSADVPTTADLKAVTFSDARHGCIVGDAQEILVTADGGVTWVERDAEAPPRVVPSWASPMHDR
jgi:photosystem II stability/assembly factor-like uncharacterized protein